MLYINSPRALPAEKQNLMLIIKKTINIKLIIHITLYLTNLFS